MTNCEQPLPLSLGERPHTALKHCCFLLTSLKQLWRQVSDRNSAHFSIIVEDAKFDVFIQQLKRGLAHALVTYFLV